MLLRESSAAQRLAFVNEPLGREGALLLEEDSDALLVLAARSLLHLPALDKQQRPIIFESDVVAAPVLREVLGRMVAASHLVIPTAFCRLFQCEIRDGEFHLGFLKPCSVFSYAILLN